MTFQSQIAARSSHSPRCSASPDSIMSCRGGMDTARFRRGLHRPEQSMPAAVFSPHRWDAGKRSATAPSRLPRAIGEDACKHIGAVGETDEAAALVRHSDSCVHRSISIHPFHIGGSRSGVAKDVTRCVQRRRRHEIFARAYADIGIESGLAPDPARFSSYTVKFSPHRSCVCRPWSSDGAGIEPDDAARDLRHAPFDKNRGSDFAFEKPAARSVPCRRQPAIKTGSPLLAERTAITANIRESRWLPRLAPPRLAGDPRRMSEMRPAFGLVMNRLMKTAAVIAPAAIIGALLMSAMVLSTAIHRTPSEVHYRVMFRVAVRMDPPKYFHHR